MKGGEKKDTHVCGAGLLNLKHNTYIKQFIENSPAKA